MNRPREKMRDRKRARAAQATGYQTLDFGKKNWLLFGAGIGAVVIGFLLLSQGDITIAPILLVGGYLGLIPWALVAWHRSHGPDIPNDPS